MSETANERECERIRGMSESELLDYILEHPECLTDPYYNTFSCGIYAAVIARHEVLLLTRTV